VDDAPAAVHLDGISVTYPGPPPVHALLPVDLHVERGDYVTIAGPSGSGKSTLLNVLGLLDRPSAGTYLLDGIDVGAADERTRSAVRGSRIGFVFQDFHLIPHRTALENVALAQLYNGVPRRERLERGAAALRLVHLGHRTHALPTTMSGGERQRVAIARAIVNDPTLLLCDEPTGNLDSTTATSVLGLLDELMATDLTIVMITHDPEVAARGTRQLHIKDGRLTELVAHGHRHR
jgi:putative ABC transport system ATP-binding protein